MPFHIGDSKQGLSLCSTSSSSPLPLRWILTQQHDPNSAAAFFSIPKKREKEVGRQITLAALLPSPSPSAKSGQEMFRFRGAFALVAVVAFSLPSCRYCPWRVIKFVVFFSFYRFSRRLFECFGRISVHAKVVQFDSSMQIYGELVSV